VDESGFVIAARDAEEAPHKLKPEVLRQRPSSLGNQLFGKLDRQGREVLALGNRAALRLFGDQQDFQKSEATEMKPCARSVGLRAA